MSKIRELFGRRTVLMFAAVVHLVLRFEDELLSLVFAGLSLSIGAGILNISQWVLFIIVIAYLTPRLYPSNLTHLTRSVLFRASVGVGVVVTAVVSLDRSRQEALVISSLIFIWFWAVVTVTLHRKNVSFFALSDRLAETVDGFYSGERNARQELTRINQYDGWKRAALLGVFMFSPYCLVATPVLAASIIIVGLVKTFPLIDLLVVIYVLGTTVASRSGLIPSIPDRFNADDYLLTFSRHAMKGPHPLIVSILFGSGIFQTFIPPLEVSRQVGNRIADTSLTLTQPLLVWNIFGLYALCLFGAGYGLWFWLRMGPRTIAFFERWSDVPRETPLKARPQSLLLPAVVATTVASAGLSTGFFRTSKHLFALTWPIPVLFLGWVAWRTRRYHPTVARYEDVVVAIAQLIAFLGLRSQQAISNGGLSEVFAMDTIILIGFSLYMLGYGRVERYGNRHSSRDSDGTDDERRYSLAVYITVGSAFAFLTTGYLTGGQRFLFYILGFILVVFGVVIGLFEYYRL